MYDVDTEKMVEIAKKTDATGIKMEYHPSIQALVKLLARKAAEEHYSELLRVIENSENASSDK